jgi:hypothetical protein
MKIDEFKAIIQEIVSEELDNVMLTERVAGTKKTRKKGKPDARRGAFTSAGTIHPSLKGPPKKYAVGSMTTGQVTAREKIGTKMLNAVNRSNKDPKARRYRKDLENRLGKMGLPANKPHVYSRIWADATSIAKRGGTNWSIAKKAGGKGKSGGKAKGKSSTKKSTAQSQQPSQNQLASKFASAQRAKGNTPE